MKSIAIYGLLFPLLAFSGWYFGRSTPPILNKEILMHRVDAVMTHVRFYEFDEQGQLSKHLIADKMEHIPFKNQFVLTQPHFSFHTADQHQWQLSSQHATTTQGIEKIIFQNHVVLTQPQSENHMSMQTQQLTYLPKATLAFTTSSVIFKQAEQRLESKGMQANLRTNEIKLSHAHATIMPKDA